MGDNTERASCSEQGCQDCRQPTEEEFLFGVPGAPVPKGVIHVDEVEPTPAQTARIRGEMVERCIERAYLWAVLRGGHEAQMAAEDLAREMRALAREDA